MASVHIPRFADIDFMFNISAGVGKNRPNHRLDVMLIQYLLNEATNVSVAGPVTSFNPIRPPELQDALVMDGIAGSKTNRFIAHYQSFRNRTATRSTANQMDVVFKVKEDGAIDPWRFPTGLNFAAAGAGGVLDSTFTLVALCFDAAKSSDVSRQSFSRMPQELVRLLCAH